ncbi:MAG: hypothetical protein R2939_08140 [Kofleriaceae bacterium]
MATTSRPRPTPISPTRSPTRSRTFYDDPADFTWVEGTGPATSYPDAFGLDLDPARRRIYVADSIRGLLILAADATIVR